MSASLLEAPARAALARAPDLAVVVPTYNERANVVEFVRRLQASLGGIAWEVVFVDDDSPDGTARLVRDLARRDPRIRVVHRLGRRGLATASVEGMLATAAPFLAVMDADLQHDEALLPRMLDALARDEAELVVASRYVEGGGVGAWQGARRSGSEAATRLARTIVGQPVTDPLSGFFMLQRALLEERMHDLSDAGFKILLDLLTASRRHVRLVELPYTFRERHAGVSKMDAAVAWALLVLILDRLTGRSLPPRFIGFAVVGAAGVAVHFAVLGALLYGAGTPFARAQALATFAAMVGNFAANNALTFRDRRLRGARWFLGLATFVLACAIGAVANVAVASYLFRHGAGWVFAGLAGILVGAVWNYSVTGTYTWGGRRRRRR